MFNYDSIGTITTLAQVKAIVEYMVEKKFDINMMISMRIVDSNKVCIDLNNGHHGVFYDVIFNDKNEIISFKNAGVWMS